MTLYKILTAGVLTLALSASAVGRSQAVDIDSNTNAADAQTERAEQAALEVVKRGDVVSVAHDHAGMALWEVRVYKPTQYLEGFASGPTKGPTIAVYLDRDFHWLESKVEGYGPDPD